MKSSGAQLNLQLAWLWILLGFIAGMVLGLFFHREDWPGGYGSFRRRMYRPRYISLPGFLAGIVVMQSSYAKQCRAEISSSDRGASAPNLGSIAVVTPGA